LTPILDDANAPWRSAIYEDGFEELYDLVADPYELENKAKDPSYAADAATLRACTIDSNPAQATAAGCLE
jgi:hypothetical protein